MKQKINDIVSSFGKFRKEICKAKEKAASKSTKGFMNRS